MVAGQLNNLRIGAIIQARMSSERMPGKVLLPLPFPDGKPILKWITDEVQKSKLVNAVFIASSEQQENSLIEQFAQENNVECYRGSEENVLSRFIYLVEKHKLDVVVRLTADNPFVDVQLLDKLITLHITNVNDYTYSSGLPIGMNFEIVSGKKLKDLADKPLSAADKEHVTYYIEKNDYKKETISLCEEKELSRLRLTLDYPSDFAAASLILNTLNEGQSPDLNFIKETRKKYPWLFDINSQNIQKQEFTNDSDEYAYASVVLKKLNLNKSAEIIDKIKASNNAR